MIKRIKANFKEFCTGFIVLIFSLSGSFFTMNKLYPSSFSDNGALSLIKEQKNAFNLISREALCLGGFRTRFYRESENTEFNLTGNLFLKVQDKPVKTALNLQAVFNPLNQQVATVLTLKGEEFEFILAGLNVNPIEITLRASAKNSQLLKKKFYLPGPINLSGDAQQLYLEYSPGGQKFPLAFNEAVRALSEIRLETLPENTEICAGLTAGSIDPIMEISNLQARLLKLMPDFSADLFSVIENKFNSELQSVK